MRTHEADWMYEATVSAYKTIKSIPDVTVVLPDVNGYEGLMMNSGKGPTADVRLRRAIAMALDKKQLTDELTYGAATVAVADLPSFMWAFDPKLKSLPFAPADARKTLVSLGYTATKPLQLDLVFEQSAAVNRALVVQIQQALRAVYIDLHVRSQLSSVIYGGYGANGTLSRGNYQLALYQWYAGVDPDNSAQFLCANRPPNGYNQSYYCSKEMDAGQAAALSSYDQAVRKPAYARIEKALVRRRAARFLVVVPQHPSAQPGPQRLRPQSRRRNVGHRQLVDLAALHDDAFECAAPNEHRRRAKTAPQISCDASAAR